MVLYFIILTLQSFADLGCEKFDGAAYDSCVLSSNKSNTVTIKEEDVDKTEETNCAKYRDAKAMKSCLEKAHQSASERAEKREERERSEPAKPTANQTETCDDEPVYASCQSAHSKAQTILQDTNRDGDAKKAAVATCMAACTRVTPSVSAKLRSCPMDKIKRINALFATNHPTCGASVAWKDNCKDYLVPGCERDLKGIEADLLNGGTGDAKTCDGKSCTATKKIAGDISLVAVTPDGKMQSIPSIYYTDSTGAKYTSLEAARNAGSNDLLSPRIDDSVSFNAEAADLDRPGRSASPRIDSEPVKPITDQSAPSTIAEKPITEADAPQSNTAPTNPTNNGAPTGVPSQNFPQGVSVASNPFAGTGFTGGTGIESSSNSEFQQSTSPGGSSSPFNSEVTSSGGDLSGGGGGNGLAPAGTAKVSYSEAVGGGGGISALGGGGSGSARNSGNATRIASTSKTVADENQLGESQPNGYYKAPGQSSKIDGKKKTVSLNGRGRKRSSRSHSKVHDCGGNLVCITKYLKQSNARSSNRRLHGGRGIASVIAHQKVNAEIGNGYGDIMSRIEKVHNNMAIDHDGNLEIPK